MTNWQKSDEFFDSVPFEPDALVLPINTKLVSDGHHTFGELYEFRMYYNALAAVALSEWGIPVSKSNKHNDGHYPFDDDTWFIVVMELPTGQVSNHYRMEYWDLFRVPEHDISPVVYDGHNSQDAAQRMHQYLKELAGDES